VPYQGFLKELKMKEFKQELKALMEKHNITSIGFDCCEASERDCSCDWHGIAWPRMLIDGIEVCKGIEITKWDL
jgi:hypothetical protein